MKSFYNYVLIGLFMLFSLNGFSQSKIDKSKDEVRKGKEKTETKTDIKTEKKDNSSSGYNYSSRRRNRDRYNDNSDDNPFAKLIASFFVIIIAGPTTGYYGMENHLDNDVTSFPYKHGNTGNYIKPDSTIAKRFPKVEIENTFLYDRDLVYGNNLNVKIRPFKYFYAQAGYIQLFEYSQLKKKYTDLSLLSFNLCYDRIRFQDFNLGWNVGVNYMGSGVKKVGFAFGFNTDIFPVKKISLHSAINWSKINGVAVNQFEAIGNYHIERWKLSIGYNRLRIGSPIYHFLSVGGGVFL